LHPGQRLENDARVARGICHFSEAFGCSHVCGL
jgi:hypothetical protein